MAHKESCKKCKEVFYKALRKEFGEVIWEWKSGWPCRIDDILTLPGLSKFTANSLNKIYTALQSHRGHKSFVGVYKLPQCDYYIKSLNCLIEFDESQHFTAPRALALSLYPRNLKIGYDKKSWRKKCLDLDRHDNHPPHRDETRAWYDTLRDILPICFGMNPTVRILAKEAIWCEDTDVTRKTIQKLIKRREGMENVKGKRKSSKSVDFSIVNERHIKQAIRKIRKDGVPSNRKAKSTDFLYANERFPAKYVLGTAYKIATGRAISPDDFTGGDATAKILFKLGFQILKNGKLWEDTKIYRIFLKGDYKREKGEHINPAFSKWVKKNHENARIKIVFKKLDRYYNFQKKPVLIFPACSLYFKDEKHKRKWVSYLKEKSMNYTLITGILDETTDPKEYTAVLNNGRFLKLHPYKPQKKLPIGNGWVFISTSIDENINPNNPGKYCLVLGHGAYKRKNKFKNISKDKNNSIIITTWYKSVPTSSLIYQNGEVVKHNIKPIYTEYGDIIDRLKGSLIKNLAPHTNLWVESSFKNLKA